ncbi:MAG: PIN domain-containing protein [archaeon]|nr:PIN domain-containing protein [archaeon]
MKRVYLDSNVFISLDNNEIGRKLRGLFIEAESFFEQVKKKNSVLVLSKLFFSEVQKKCHSNKEEVLHHFKNSGIKTEVIEKIEELNLKQFENKGIHYPDSVHAAIAIKYNCDCIVTFNIKDFENIKDLIEVLEPLEFM